MVNYIKKHSGNIFFAGMLLLATSILVGLIVFQPNIHTIGAPKVGPQPAQHLKVQPKPSINTAAVVPVSDDAQINEFVRTLHLEPYQYENLLLAQQIGKQDDLSLTLMGILWQETKAGKLGPVGDTSLPFGKRSYGLMQVKLATARRVINRYPNRFPDMTHVTGEEIIARLIYDKAFNLRVACGYLLMLRDRGLSWREMVTAYNQGYTGSQSIDPDDWPYTQSVIHSLRGGKISQLQGLMASRQ